MSTIISSLIKRKKIQISIGPNFNVGNCPKAPSKHCGLQLILAVGYFILENTVKFQCCPVFSQIKVVDITIMKITDEHIMLIFLTIYFGIKKFESSWSDSLCPCKFRIAILSLSIKVYQCIPLLRIVHNWSIWAAFNFPNALHLIPS